MELTADELSRYLQRIGYPLETAEPDIETLRTLHRLHPRAIPFENLDSFRGRAVTLDPDAVFDKLVGAGRGGYCFEHNQLFLRVLLTLGYPVFGLSARVQWMRAEDESLLPRTHKALLVNVDGVPYIADVGFGGQTMTAPLRLDSEQEQASSHEPLKVTPDGPLYRVSSLVADTWQPLYDCSLDAYLPVDYETANWYVSTHPESRFVTSLICSRVDEAGRHVLIDRRYSRYRLDAAPETRELETPAQLRQLLADTFGIELAGVASLDERLQALFGAKP